MSALPVAEFEGRLEQYGIERSEEARAVRVGEKETSEQAAIVARYADLFTRDQLDGLRVAEADASDAERESIARLRLECQEFVDAIREEREPRCGGQEGLAVVEVLEAMQTSLEGGGRVVQLTA